MIGKGLEKSESVSNGSRTESEEKYDGGTNGSISCYWDPMSFPIGIRYELYDEDVLQPNESS